MDLLETKHPNNNEISVPLGDKGTAGERDDLIKSKNRLNKYLHLQRYEYAAKRSKGRILDVGCGTGYGTKILSNKGNAIYGIDNSQKAIDYAEKTYPGPKYACCPAEKLPFEDNYFDAVTAFEVIEHVQNPKRVLNEIFRVLKKDGDLFISTPNPRHLGNMIKHFLLKQPYPKKVDMSNIYHIKEFYYEELLDFFKKVGFRIIARYGQTLPIIFPFQREIIYLLRMFPFFYKIPILLGYYFPKYAGGIVVWAKK